MPTVWPTPDDYDRSMRRLHERVLDEEIRCGRIVEDEMGHISYFGGAKLYTSLYRVQTFPSSLNPAGDWTIRCFCTNQIEPPKDIKRRYKEISHFCMQNYWRLSALLPVVYVEEGINVYYSDEGKVKSGTFPIVKIPFIATPSLGSFISEHYQESNMMEQLCIAWLKMIRELEMVEMAHGDLDLTNVLVVQEKSSLLLKLIDYDNVWIPALRDHPQSERGHVHFQHPAFSKKRPYDARMHRFSALVIYISIRALQFHPELYKSYKVDEENQLLFTLRDYEAETQPVAGSQYLSQITHLRQMEIAVLNPYLDELSNALKDSRMPCAVYEVPPPPPVLIDIHEGTSEPASTVPNSNWPPDDPFLETWSATQGQQMAQVGERRWRRVLLAVLLLILVSLIILIIIGAIVLINNLQQRHSSIIYPIISVLFLLRRRYTS